MKKIIYLFTLIAITMIGCSPQGFEADDDGKVLSITVKEAVYVSSGTPSMQLSLKDNEELQLNVVIMPQNAKNKNVTFSNKHPELMEISETGLIKAKAIGTDTLIVSATDGSGVSTRFVVNISDHMVKATAINVTAEGSNILFKKGGAAFDLGACVTLAPADTWNRAVTYTSNDQSIATVSASGIVTPVNIGNTTITIKTSDGSNLSKDCNVTVQDLVIREVDLDCTNWTVATQTHNSYGYMWDGGTQAAPVTGLPEHLFDGQIGSYLSLVKPGGSLNGVNPPVDSTPPSFIVDMKSTQEFGYIKWSHRNGTYSNSNGSVGTNIYNYLRVFGVIIEGSNDGTNFAKIAPSEPAGSNSDIVWIPQKASYVGSATSTEDTSYTIPVTKSTYRYVKVNLVVNSFSYKTDKYQHPDYPGNGHTGGNSMQVAEFGLGNIVIE
ncbi:MAG: Ig-like domain-containing protein [Dysgonomonas sp.]